MVWQPGTKLEGGTYTITEVLSEGGYGITYLAQDHKDKEYRSVVIKTLNDRVRHSSEFGQIQQDFLNEALLLPECIHPHIVKVDHVFKEGGLWCIAMEYIPGENLSAFIIKHGVLPEAEALNYIHQIGAALSFAHSKHVLHRDVKPENIMLRLGQGEITPPLEAVLIDFGLARKFIYGQAANHPPLCTHGFAPIEQYVRYGERGPYTDVYALAATLYKCLTKKVPVSALDRSKQAIDPLIPPQQINPKVSDTVNWAILRGMAIEPPNRPQSVDEWLALLAPDDLSSDAGIDYTNLRNLLRQRNWRKADEETLHLILKAAGGGNQSWLNVAAIKRVPAKDLRTIDKLWVKYSQGRFGFSIQKRIWESILGTPAVDDYERKCNFAHRVGWRVNNRWLYYNNLSFSTNAPWGHLPAELCFREPGWSRVSYVLASRL